MKRDSYGMPLSLVRMGQHFRFMNGRKGYQMLTSHPMPRYYEYMCMSTGKVYTVDAYKSEKIGVVPLEW